MIVLLGASGYIGEAFRRVLQRQEIEHQAISRRDFDYTDFHQLLRFLQERRPEFLINAAGFTGKPNVDACETARADTLQGNTLLPIAISHACAVSGTPWGHVSSGCIYQGAKIHEGEKETIHVDLTTPVVQRVIRDQPDRLEGFREEDAPNFSFRNPPSSFYSGTKALAEESLAQDRQVYIWRVRIPFDEWDGPRNYLSKLQRYPRVYDNVNSLSHRIDFAEAALGMWQRRLPFGIYNMTNPGYVTARQVVELIQEILKPERKFEFWKDDAEFYSSAAQTPRSNCVLDVTKLLAAGIRLRPVEEAVVAALESWQR